MTKKLPNSQPPTGGSPATEYLKLLGKKAKDKVSGFTGIVSCVSFDLYGCVQAVLVPQIAKDGTLKDGSWFDAKRLSVLNEAAVMPPPDFANIAIRQETGAAAKPPCTTHTR